METDRNTDIDPDPPDGQEGVDDVDDGEGLEDDVEDVEAGAEEEAKADAGVETPAATLRSANAFRAAESGR